MSSAPRHHDPIYVLTRKGSKTTPENRHLGDKLNQQFRYFRSEFVKLALHCGVTVPLDIVEDDSGKMYNFIKQGGPEYIFQMLLSEHHSMNLIRVSLSLMITTISVLQLGLPHAEGGIGPEGGGAVEPSIRDWIQASIKKIVDVGAVSACVTLLLQSSLPDNQTTAVCLLAHLVAVSKEAAVQMMHPINSHLEFDSMHLSPGEADADSGPSPKKSIPHMKKHNHVKPASNQIKSDSCLSYLLTVCATYRNRIIVVGHCADIITSVSNAFPTSACALLIAKSPTCYLPALPSSTEPRGPSSKDSAASKGLSSAAASVSAAVSSAPHRVNDVGVIEWMGIKLFLKFLHRIQVFGVDSSAVGQDDQSGEAHVPANSQQVTDVMHRVFIAAATLCSRSTQVTAEVLRLPGAEELLRTTGAAMPPSPTIASLIQKCNASVRAAKTQEPHYDHSSSRILRQDSHHNRYAQGNQSDGSAGPSSITKEKRLARKMEPVSAAFQPRALTAQLPPIESIQEGNESVTTTTTEAVMKSQADVDVVYDSLQLQFDNRAREPLRSSIESDTGSVSSSVGGDSHSISWALKNAPSKPKIPDIVPGILNSKALTKLQPESRPTFNVAQNSRVFDQVPNPEIRKLLKKGFKVPIRALSPINASS